MRYIIMCGGTYPKWGDTPRQLLKLPSGETIVGRTIRLLRENGVTDPPPLPPPIQLLKPLSPI